MVNIAEESHIIARQRRKLAEQIAEENKEYTPENLQKVKEVIPALYERSQQDRVSVPGKGLSLFTQGGMKEDPLYSAKVKAVMKQISDTNQIAPVA